MNKIVVVDYGMGNLRSVAQALRHVAPEADVRISGEVADIRAADRVVLPGQGAMRDCMRSLRSSGLEEAVIASSKTKPLFGVCVGEQMLFDWSEEGDTPCLGLLPGKVVRFDLGFSYRQQRPVLDLILERLPATLVLTVTAFSTIDHLAQRDTER